MKPAIHCSKRVHYWNFGFIPSGSLRHDLRGKLFGHPNLLKRLQAREIMSALHLQPSDTALDLGCGAGFFTVEMAKMAQKAYGIDINPYVKAIQVPPALRGRLEYIQVSAERLPFAEEHFDKVLASEVLPMIPDPNRFLEEIRRVLKSGGRLLIANGAGHPNIEEAYRRRPLFFQWLKKAIPTGCPPPIRITAPICKPPLAQPKNASSKRMIFAPCWRGRDFVLSISIIPQVTDLASTSPGRSFCFT